MIPIWLILLATHFIADFVCQSQWLGTQKGKSWELMIYHCLIYSLVFVLIVHVSPIIAGILFITHLIIDPLKARYNIIKKIYWDQALHMIVLAGVWFLMSHHIF
jgi:hypothetical protein